MVALMDDNRLNPDDILKKINEEAKAQTRGQLKIFFGYAAGVGKTSSMLKAAHEAKERGIDVVVGYVEPHTRPQTMELLTGLEVLPPIKMNYKGMVLKEFDLDGAMQRKPQLILVDELAHTNAEGCRHNKRFQDIEELLKAGMHVYTTVNVQHIESLNDLVSSITGIMVRERIPDSVFDSAEQVELVDIEPEELIERLYAGKIYKESQVEKAVNHFFTVENLVALRELALRRCADRVNQISDKIKLTQNSEYYTEEHILVCLSSSPTNAKIIRTAGRMAKAFHGRFTALFVETPNYAAMGEENQKRLRSNMHLAGKLGATIETVYGDDIALQISEFARMSSVSKIVLGRNNAKRKTIFSKPSLTDKLTVSAPNLDIYIIPDREAVRYAHHKKRTANYASALPDTLKSIAVLVSATLIGFLFAHLGFRESNIIMVYILGVLITALLTTQRVYSMVSSLVSVLIFNFFFTVPKFSFDAYDSGYPVTFLIMFLSAFITGTLAVKIKQHARQAAEMAYRTKILLETNQLLQKAREKQDIIEVTANQLTKLLRKTIVYYVPQQGEVLQPKAFPAMETDEVENYISENERAVAAWVFKNNKHAGATTNTLGNACCMYLAVRVNEKVYGVVGIAMDKTPLDSFENSIVLSILGECALALENEAAAKERADAALLAKNEQLRANLLRSISHDLRTPLTAISGNAGILLANEEALDKEKKKMLYTDIYEDSLWLINLVENLLSVTRIEDGTIHLKLTAELMDEVISEALHHVKRKSIRQTITVKQAEDFILAKMDARLIVQVIINIVDNAIKYTPEGSEIIIDTKKKKDKVIVEIADNGGGIPDESKERIFDMFYTEQNKVADSRRSLGLGLALCKSIITAHGGEISVQDNQPKGTIFRFTLQAEEVTLHE